MLYTKNLIIAGFVLLVNGCSTISESTAENPEPPTSKFQKKVDQKVDRTVDKTTDKALNKTSYKIENKIDQYINKMFD